MDSVNSFTCAMTERSEWVSQQENCVCVDNLQNMQYTVLLAHRHTYIVENCTNHWHYSHTYTQGKTANDGKNIMGLCTWASSYPERCIYGPPLESSLPVLYAVPNRVQSRFRPAWAMLG